MREPEESPPGRGPSSWLPSPGLLGVSLGVGAVTGILAKLADVSGSSDLEIITSNIAVWVLGVCLWGSLARRPVDAVARSAAFSLTMNVGYYGWATAVLGDHWPPIASMWILIGLTAVPLIALAVFWAVRTSGPWSGGVLALVAAIALIDEPVSRAWGWFTGGARTIPQAPVAAAVAVLVWAVVVFVLPRHRATRWWGLAFALPGFVLVSRVAEVGWPVLLNL